MDILIAGRQEGKTIALMEWVEEGHRVDGYPGWSRIAVLPTIHDVLNAKKIWWETMDDFDHRVYALVELLKNRYLTSADAEYRFDNMDLILGQLIPGVHIGGFTITGKEWAR